MKLQQVKVKVISGGDAAALEASLSAFLETVKEAEFIEALFAANADGLHVTLIYTT